MDQAVPLQTTTYSEVLSGSSKPRPFGPGFLAFPARADGEDECGVEGKGEEIAEETGQHTEADVGGQMGGRPVHR
jgi:hypothetical protein